MGKHDKTDLDYARDELFSHIQRCGALEATPEDKAEWLDETIEYIKERYPGLTQLQLRQVELMGKRYLKPAIPHGKASTALNRSDWTEEEEETAATA